MNPKHFDFGCLNVETKKYDLPEFVKNHVVNANVAPILAQVEPPYPAINARFWPCTDISPSPNKMTAHNSRP